MGHPEGMIALLLLACSGDLPDAQEVTLDDGVYYALIPADWDGEAPLPASVHFHGAGGSAEQYYGNEDVVQGFSDAGVLLLLPEGEGGFFDTSPEPGDRDDMAFVEAIWEDAEARWPIDAAREYATGFSVGGSVVATLGCDYGERYAALAPMSGGFWFPAPDTCGGPAVPISHTHGTADGTWPLEGRCFREADDGSCERGQSPMDDNFAIWTELLQCGEATETSTDGPLTCETWTDCANGELRLCLHDEGHTRLDGWAARQAGWLLSHAR